jgi:hypothetical protein
MKGIGMKKFSGISVAVAVLAAATLAGCPVPTPEFHTQSFAAGAVDIAGSQLYYQPDSSTDFYSRTVTTGITAFSVPTTGQTVVNFDNGNPFVLNLAAGSEVMYYGNTYSTLYIGANGTVAFEANATGNGSTTAHFQSKQISLLPVDAADAAETGTVGYQIFNDSVVVTFDGVDGSSFQSEFFISGTMDQDIAIAYPTIGADAAGVVGLSNGPLAGANAAQIAAFLTNEFGNGSDIGTTNTSTAKLGF